MRRRNMVMTHHPMMRVMRKTIVLKVRAALRPKRRARALLLLAGQANALEKVFNKLAGKVKAEWVQVDMEDGLRKAGLKSLFPEEASAHC